jgi:hypothetical protein
MPPACRKICQRQPDADQRAVKKSRDTVANAGQAWRKPVRKRNSWLKNAHVEAIFNAT